MTSTTKKRSTPKVEKPLTEHDLAMGKLEDVANTFENQSRVADYLFGKALDEIASERRSISAGRWANRHHFPPVPPAQEAKWHRDSEETVLLAAELLIGDAQELLKAVRQALETEER